MTTKYEQEKFANMVIALQAAFPTTRPIYGAWPDCVLVFGNLASGDCLEIAVRPSQAGYEASVRRSEVGTAFNIVFEDTPVAAARSLLAQVDYTRRARYAALQAEVADLKAQLAVLAPTKGFAAKLLAAAPAIRDALRQWYEREWGKK